MLLLGCGSEGLQTAPVRGKVLLDGRPLGHGAVTFVPKQGRAATGQIQSDGTFTLSTYGRADGAVTGEHKIAVTCSEKVAEKVAEKEKGSPSLDAGLMPAATRSLIPRRYNQPDRSGLTFEVKAGQKNEALLELNSRPGAP